MILKLTPAQKAQIAPLLAKALEEDSKGRTGMVVAQVWDDEMRAGFLPHEIAKRFVRVAPSEQR